MKDNLKALFGIGSSFRAAYVFVWSILIMSTLGLIYNGVVHPEEDTQGLSAVGSIFTEGKVIERKHESSFAFSHLANKASLYAQDTIFVGEKSKALLNLGKFGFLRIKEGSVVALEFYEPVHTDAGKKYSQALRIKLVKGSVKFEKKLSDEPEFKKLKEDMQKSIEESNAQLTKSLESVGKQNEPLKANKTLSLGAEKNLSAVSIEVANGFEADVSNQASVSLQKKENFEVVVESSTKPLKVKGYSDEGAPVAIELKSGSRATLVEESFKTELTQIRKSSEEKIFLFSKPVEVQNLAVVATKTEVAPVPPAEEVRKPASLNIEKKELVLVVPALTPLPPPWGANIFRYARSFLFESRAGFSSSNFNSNGDAPDSGLTLNAVVNYWWDRFEARGDWKQVIAQFSQEKNSTYTGNLSGSYYLIDARGSLGQLMIGPEAGFESYGLSQPNSTAYSSVGYTMPFYGIHEHWVFNKYWDQRARANLIYANNGSRIQLSSELRYWFEQRWALSFSALYTDTQIHVSPGNTFKQFTTSVESGISLSY